MIIYIYLLSFEMCCPILIFECTIITLMMVQACTVHISSSNTVDCNIFFLNTQNEKHLAKSSRFVQYHCYNAGYPWVQL